MADRNLDCIKIFRNQLVDFLKDSEIEGIGENVFAARIEKAWPEEEAFIVVAIPQVNFTDGRTSPRFYMANADVTVDIYARDSFGPVPPHKHQAKTTYEMADFLNDTAQKVCELVDPLNGKDGPFAGAVKRIVLKSFTNNLSEQEMVRGAMRIVFGIEFSVCINHTSPADEFLTAKNHLKVGEGEGNQQDFDTNVRP